MHKTLIIPDIHTSYLAAELVIERERPEKVVFLGDYFDSFYEEIADTDNTAGWLAESLQKNNRLHLIGNHDLSYMSTNPRLKCSGFSEAKKFIINKHHIPWQKLRPYCYVGDYLCTHAGVSRQFFEQHATSDIAEFMKGADEDMKHVDDARYSDRFFQVGRLRGGQSEHGGIFWCDYDEFADIPNVKQIFGHTNAAEVRRTGDHICLDTGLRHYAVYEDGKMAVRRNRDRF